MRGYLAELRAADPSRFVTIAQRRDFYRWFYDYTAAQGYTTRWALCAWLMSNSAYGVATVDRDVALANGVVRVASAELSTFMRTGNQVIFDDVFPKLGRLLRGGRLTGSAALEWDMRVLAEEQSLVQPMYDSLGAQTMSQLEAIARKQGAVGLGLRLSDDDKIVRGRYHRAGRIPAFDLPDLRSVGQRWRYGMALADRFAPERTGFGPEHRMPTVAVRYRYGAAHAQVNRRPNLHGLDARLASGRRFRTAELHDELIPIVSRLTAHEKWFVLGDVSADGWSYAERLARCAVESGLVRRALPDSGGAEVDGFMSRYRAARGARSAVVADIAEAATLTLRSPVGPLRLAMRGPRATARLATGSVAFGLAVPATLLRLGGAQFMAGR